MSTDAPVDDVAHRKRRIAGSIWLTVPGTVAVVAAAYAAMPPLQGVDSAPDRLVMAVRWLFVAFLPYAAVALAILHLRFFEGAHNPLLGQESAQLAIHCRVMQNTLEQLVWFALCLLPLATLLSPVQARVVPVLCVAFVAARLLYWWGYFRASTLGRAPGVQVTFTISIGMLAHVIWLLLDTSR